VGEEDDHHRPALRCRRDRRPVEALAGEHRSDESDRGVGARARQRWERRSFDGDRADLADQLLGERVRRSCVIRRVVVIASRGHDRGDGDDGDDHEQDGDDEGRLVAGGHGSSDR
jgi:hypothetical protein